MDIKIIERYCKRWFLKIKWIIKYNLSGIVAVKLRKGMI